MATTPDVMLEAIERVLIAASYAGTDRVEIVYFPDDEGGMRRRDADRVTTVVEVEDVRLDKRSGGSIYRRLTASVGMQHHRNKKTRPKKFADARVTEDELRHLRARAVALDLPGASDIHEVRLVSGPRFDNTSSTSSQTKALTQFVVEITYNAEG